MTRNFIRGRVGRTHGKVDIKPAAMLNFAVGKNSNLRVVLYKDEHSPRSLTFNLGYIYRTAILFGSLVFLVLILGVLVVRNHMKSPVKTADFNENDASESTFGPTHSQEDVIRSLKDDLSLAQMKLVNLQNTQAAPREIDSKNPALALFSPIVQDRTQNQKLVKIENFKVSKDQKDKNLITLTFELHNAVPGEAVQKGYIVVLGRGESSLQAYPNVFAKVGPFLVDFEKGETFQVARFRLVNAQFNSEGLKNFQILIFTRSGELLINTLYEAGGSS